MRLALPTLAIALLAATPAFADGARMEVRTGIGSANNGDADATIGGALGYDWSLGGAFVGVEQSADKILASNEKLRWGTSGRIGAHIAPATKIYATGGYNYGTGPHGSDAGAGLEQNFGPLYGKVEYKHFFNNNGVRDANAGLVGVGIHF